MYLNADYIQLSESFFFFFFNDTATTEIYTLSLHDALPISGQPPLQPSSLRFHSSRSGAARLAGGRASIRSSPRRFTSARRRSEEHTSELQSRLHLVCRLLLEKKKIRKPIEFSREQNSSSVH